MTTFAYEKIETLTSPGVCTFLKLIWNECCYFDEFCIEANKNYPTELRTLLAYMDMVAKRNTHLPITKFNSIRNKGKVVGYEFKTKHLRVYIIKSEPNVIVVLGGYKNTQDKDITKFTDIASQITHLL